ncbi:MAG: Rnase Y domain-containing protein, partial [Myxococcota bacterium]
FLRQQRQLRERERDYERRLRDLEISGKEEALRLEREFEARERDARAALEEEDQNVSAMAADRDASEKALDEREGALLARADALGAGENRLKEQEQDLEQERGRIAAELERTAQLTQEQAREELVASVLDRAREEAGKEILALKEEADATARAHAAVVVASAAHRMAADFVSSQTVTVVPLASDEMKGRIIGREGRNIRALEYATGVDVIVDDTPELVVLSGFSPLRREIARRALEQLLDDGRIHPARIEEVVHAVREDLDAALADEGEAFATELDIGALGADLCRMAGRLRLHPQGGGTVHDLARQTAVLAGTMADELSVDSALARRSAFFLALGYVSDHTLGGNHREAAYALARQHRESAGLQDVLAALANGTPDSVVAALVDVAHRLVSGRRAGAVASAAPEDQSIYIRRYEEMEALARSFAGVREAHVIQAGREVRVMVNFTMIDDATTAVLAEDIAAGIRSESRFPGEVRVMVVREARATEVAR